MMNFYNICSSNFTLQVN